MEVVGRGDGPHSARRPGAPLEEGARAHPGVGGALVGGHDESGDGGGPGIREGGQQRREPVLNSQTVQSLFQGYHPPLFR